MVDTRRDVPGHAQISSNWSEPQSGHVAQKKYEPPTLEKRAVLSAITSEDGLQISGQTPAPI